MFYPEPGYREALPDAEREAVRAEYLTLADDARCLGAARLQPVEAANLGRGDRAGDAYPGPRLGGAVEVRPVVQR